MNLRKSVLSLATIMALSSSISADGTATYLPLSSSTTDSVWTLFGVNGFSDGTPSSLNVTAAGSFQAGFSELTDDTTTDYASDDGSGGSNDGLIAASGDGINGDRMATLQSLDGVASLKVGMDMSGTYHDSTESVRTMYIRVAGDTQNVQLEYKASLEGKGVEILYDGVLYSTYISQTSTWADAVKATAGGLTTAASTSDRSAILEILDQDFTNNPANPAHFDKDVHLDTTTLTRGNFYHFNAINQQWEVWNANAATNANDFVSLDKGKAYWGRTDKADIIPNGDGPSGLILGQATSVNGIPDPTRYNDDSNVSRLTDGWNMISFDDSKPTIRHAATGLIVTGIVDTDTLVITDDSGLHSYTYDISAGANVITEALAIAINEGIETAKLLGTLPSSFNVKMLWTADGDFVFISDKKFTIHETDGTGAITVTTLTGANPYVSGVRTAIAGVDGVSDLDTLGPVTSAYGEYAMIVDLMVDDLTGGDTAATLDETGSTGATWSSKIMFGQDGVDNAAVELAGAADDATITFAEAKSNVETDDDLFNGTTGTGLLTAIDIDNSGALDKVIIASDEKFYVKDSTFVKVLTVTPNTSVNNLTLDGSSQVAIATDATPTVAELVALVQGQSDVVAGNTGIYAHAGTTAANIILVSTNADSFDLKDAPSATLDLLSRASSDANDVAKGAVGGVYAIDELAALPLVQSSYTVEFTAAMQPNDALDQISINVNGLGAVNNTAGAVVTTAEKKAWFDEIVSIINTAITGASLHGYATHDYSETTDNFTTAVVLVQGVDIDSIAFLEVGDTGADTTPPANPTDTNTATAGTLGTLPTLTDDLKSNPIYAPDFAIYGPLYTLREAGYDVRGMLKATTDMDTDIGINTGGTIAWDSIDITRHEDDWFANNEFNLFKINNHDGYWVYLDSKGADTVSIGTPEFSSVAYSYYFDNDTGLTTTNMIQTASLSVEITGLDDSNSANTDENAGSAYATIGGEKVQLKRSSANSNIYTANVSDMALANFDEDTSPITVDIRAVNGKGQSVEKLESLSIDYVKPTNLAVTSSNAAQITLSVDSNTTENFYVFEDYIPELAASRATAISAGTAFKVPATTDISATFEPCKSSSYSFGDVKNFRVVAADGDMDASNVSNAKDFSYALTLKGAVVLTQTQSPATNAEQLGRVYNESCVKTLDKADQEATDNKGVSLKTLTTGFTSSMSFDAEDTSFDRDLAWTANYALTGGGTAVVQIQSTSAYAGKTFFLEYADKLYKGTFVSSEAAADASTTGGASIALTEQSVGNNTLAE